MGESYTNGSGTGHNHEIDRAVDDMNDHLTARRAIIELAQELPDSVTDTGEHHIVTF